MLKKIGLSIALTLATAAPALAQSAACIEPKEPPILDGGTANQGEMLADIGAVKSYIALSDRYQECLGAALNAQKAQAEKNKTPLDPAVQAGLMAKANANQAAKEKIGGYINVEIAAYKKAHPGG